LGVGIVTLRSAIQYINAQGQPSNTINFGISGTGPFTIAPATDLDAITSPVTINGYSQSGSSVNTLAVGDNAVLQIILNGSNYTVGDGITTGNGLTFTDGSSNSVVRGLVINQWILAGILVNPVNANVSGVSIVGNFFGTNATGTQTMNNQVDVGLSAGPDFNVSVLNTSIGTTAVADRNIFAGSFGGFVIVSPYFFHGAAIASVFNEGTSVVNNYIGVDKTGTTALGNSLNGIYFRFEFGSTIGGTTAAERNIISGHTVMGIRLRACSEIVIQGNYIGTDVSGTMAIGNQNSGIELDDDFTEVGYTTGSSVINNLISGNGTGIRIGDVVLLGANINTVQGNYIGTDFTGTKALPNNFWGIIANAAQNTIGGSVADQLNLISGNLVGGILVYAIPATQNIFSHNLIGTDITGTKTIPNGGNGVQIGLYGGLGGASNNTFN
jgi:hypothetical protein